METVQNRPTVNESFEIVQLVFDSKIEEAIARAGDIAMLNKITEFSPVASKKIAEYVAARETFFAPENLGRTVSNLGTLFAYDYFTKSSPETYESSPIKVIQQPVFGRLYLTNNELSLDGKDNISLYQLLLALLFRSYHDQFGEFILCPLDTAFPASGTYRYVKLYLRSEDAKPTKFLREKMLMQLCRLLRIGINQLYPLTYAHINWTPPTPLIPTGTIEKTPVIIPQPQPVVEAQFTHAQLANESLVLES